MPQLQINQGPQDALLYDNSKSYFKQVGYSRTSNFQIEYRDVDPANTASLGSTVQFVMPKCADLMGSADLMIDFETLSKTVVDGLAHGVSGEVAYYGWVESLGFAMIDNITVSVGSHECERITGDALYIQNELMRSEEQRYNCQHVLKTGRALVEQEFYYDTTASAAKHNTLLPRDVDYNNGTRLLCAVGEMALPRRLRR